MSHNRKFIVFVFVSFNHVMSKFVSNAGGDPDVNDGGEGWGKGGGMVVEKCTRQLVLKLTKPIMRESCWNELCVQLSVSRVVHDQAKVVVGGGI